VRLTNRLLSFDETRTVQKTKQAKRRGGGGDTHRQQDDFISLREGRRYTNRQKGNLISFLLFFKYTENTRRFKSWVILSKSGIRCSYRATFLSQMYISVLGSCLLLGSYKIMLTTVHCFS
jgi:hypothetical protein